MDSRIEHSQRFISGNLTTGVYEATSDSCAEVLSCVNKPVRQSADCLPDLIKLELSSKDWMAKNRLVFWTRNCPEIKPKSSAAQQYPSHDGVWCGGMGE